MNVSFIWYASRSQQMLSFDTGRFLNIQVDTPSYVKLFQKSKSLKCHAPQAFSGAEFYKDSKNVIENVLAQLFRVATLI